MKENLEENNNIIREAPPTAIYNDKELEAINYDCTECFALIKILSINEENNDIKFKCINNHIKEILIKEYLKHIEKNKDKIINEICELHKEVYTFYCFNCNRHICNKCIKLKKEHKNHKKEFILEIQPDE